MNFWHNLPKPIIGLSPMDGVTDAPYRHIVAKYGKPDVLFTEFCSIDGLIRDIPKLLEEFVYSEIERPIVAQIYGKDLEAFYLSTFIVCALGFDGVDVNMGCPAKSVANRGCGAALIQTPELAKDIMRTVQRAVNDWTNGKTLEEVGVGKKILKKISEMQALLNWTELRKKIPVTVKTRVGFDKISVEEWVSHLLETEPVVISLHGRTLKQMYRGEASWEAIARAAEIIKKTDTLVLGNGDINDLVTAKKRIVESGVDGILIGRGSYGNPWIFNHKETLRQAVLENVNITEEYPVEKEERFRVLAEHAKHYENFWGGKKFYGMRKHMGWYCKHFRHAKDLRVRLFLTKTVTEVEQVLAEFK